MESALQGQMIRPYFPVELTALAAARAFTAVEPGDRWQVLFHHDPESSDATLDRSVRLARKDGRRRGRRPKDWRSPVARRMSS